MVKRRRKSESCAGCPVLIGESIFALLKKMGGCRERAGMEAVWKNWCEITGEEIAQMASPAGYHGTTLIVSAEDAIDMQEISMQSELILERVNNFLKSEYFTKLKVTLEGTKGP